MHRFIIPTAALTLFAVDGLTTDYAAERTLRIVAETQASVETTDFSFERDGEPQDSGGRGFGGGGSELSREIVQLDTVLAHADGEPIKVKREFDTVESTTSRGGRDGETRETEADSPMDGETLILSLDDDGDVVAALESGDDPDEGSMLEGHSLTLALDALLPDGDVDSGDSWEIDKDALLRALAMDVERALFPRAAPEGGGEGRGGRGGFGGGRGGGSPVAFFNDADWEGKGTYTGSTEEIEGLECAVIELEFEAEGDLPERQFGRTPRESFFGPAGTWSVLESTYEVTLEGKLYFSLEEKRPVKLELEGEFTLETNREFDRGGSTMSMSTTREGEYEYTVTVTLED